VWASGKLREQEKPDTYDSNPVSPHSPFDDKEVAMRTLAIVLAVTIMISIATTIDSAIVKVVMMNDNITVTAYSKQESCSKSNVDCKTASGIPVALGHAAMSRDLEKQGLRFGDRIHLNGIGTFVIQDRTHSRWKKRIDIFMESHRSAIVFGKKKASMIAIRDGGWVSA
jgi:3D (Asp-Asp-Asp) domain-containing protein